MQAVRWAGPSADGRTSFKRFLRQCVILTSRYANCMTGVQKNSDPTRGDAPQEILSNLICA